MKISEVDGLAGAAAAADAGLPVVESVAPGESTAGAAADPAREWAQFPALFGSIVSQAMPELKAVYTDAACVEWGKAMVPLAEKYGWTPGAFMAWLGPWIGVGVATWPLAAPTFAAIRARRAAGAPAPAGPSATVTTFPPPAAPAATDDPDFRDPTKTNRPPRPH